MKCNGKQQRRGRPGIVLILVLVVIVLLSLAAYTFSDLMLTERDATLLSGEQVQAHCLVESGVDMLRLYLSQDYQTRLDAGGHLDNPYQFQGVLVVDDADARHRGRFTVTAPALDTYGVFDGIRYGLEDESARINVNALTQGEKLDENTQRQLLMAMPGMTEDVADAILDWIDEDDEPREYGAELEYYSALDPPYEPKNGSLDSVEELLLVRGVTPQLLFGLDTNHNGMVDAHEQQAQANGTAANATSDGSYDLFEFDGTLDRGWSAYLTLYSAERNVDSMGEPRTFVNGDDMEQLYDELSAVMDEDWATFIIAYRQNGPYNAGSSGSSQGSGDGSGRDSAGGSDPGESRGGDLKASPAPTPGRTPVPSLSPMTLLLGRAVLAQARGGEQAGRGGGDRGGRGGQAGRGGGDRGGQAGRGGGDRGGRGGQAGRGGGDRGGRGGDRAGGGRGDRGQRGGGGQRRGGRGDRAFGTQPMLLVAPGGGGRRGGGGGTGGAGGGEEVLTPEPVNGRQVDLTQPGKTKLKQVLDLIGAQVRVTFQGEDKPTLIESPFSNDPAAMAEYLPVLMEYLTVDEDSVIPGRININQAPRAVLMAIPGMTEDMVAQILALRDVQSADDASRSVPTWLLTEGIVTLDQMKSLLPYVTTRGDVLRAQVVGYYDGGGVSSRVEVVLDATIPLPRILFWRELGHLGRGYPLDVLGADMSGG